MNVIIKKVSSCEVNLMANPQPDQFTRISNELMEQIPKFRLNGTQFRILFIVLRYTYGFNRKEYAFSLSFFGKALNINRRQIQRELKRLIYMNILHEEKNGNSTRIIALNKDYDSWLNTSVDELDNVFLDNGELDNVEKDNGELAEAGVDELDITSNIPVLSNLPPKKEIRLNKVFKERFKGSPQEEKRAREEDKINTPEREIYDSFEKNIHPLPSQPELEELGRWLDDGIESGAIDLALREANFQGARNISYVRVILNNWFKVGIKTREQAESYLRDYYQNKASPEQTARSGTKRKVDKSNGRNSKNRNGIKEYENVSNLIINN